MQTIKFSLASVLFFALPILLTGYVHATSTTIDGDISSSTMTISGPVSLSTLTVNNAARFSAGTASLPSISFTNDPDTGFYNHTANGVSISAAGNEIIDIEPGRFEPFTDNNISLGRTNHRYIALWAVNGTIQTSAYKSKREVKEIVSDVKTKTVKLIDVAVPTGKIQSISNGMPVIPRAIMFKWKKGKGIQDDQNYIGFLADDLPLEAHPKKEDGSVDMENVYTTAVIGILCSTVRDLQRQVADLQSKLPK